MNDTVKLLKECNAGVKMGVTSISRVMPYVKNSEMKNSLKKTFAFVKRFRRRLELGDRMLFNAINIIMNINNTTPLGDWDMHHDWSYDYIEETKERFNQLLQGHNEGVVKDETLCAWINNLTEEEAAKYMAELKATAKPDIIDPDVDDDDGIGA